MADAPDLPPPTTDSPPAGGSGPVPPAPVAPAAVVSPPKPRSGLGASLHALWTLVVRLLLLGVGVSAGWLAGMAVAQFFPARNPEPPLTEVVLRQGSQTRQKLQRLPQWWRGEDAVGLSTPVGTAAPEPLIEAPAAAPTEPDAPGTAANGLGQDLASLRQDLASLETRLGELETSLDLPSTGSLSERLERLDQRLGEEDETAEAETPAAASQPPVVEASPPTAAVPYQEPQFPLVRDRIVLPSALLFEPGSSILTPAGQQLLDTIAPDLRRYGVATLLVGSHTDSTAAPEATSQLTLQQSLAVQQYLAPQLEGSGSRWVAVGYGSTRPLVTAAGANPSRNQRVEIGIVPGR
ncbi:OmpA family protein [Leptolyngbya sp. KIOST-1]|uniref:OmpA family protein n=1 Tax=Leptolyngbya sp. KIOST-1 TaxID=1229172 RepID=UPI000B123E19|nr:OmpA family protein [Leptolyngbya sp. KIOST-1]